VLGPDAEQPAATMIGVQALGYPEMLVEIEVTAVV
jgi:enamine deaminase RidA (YjgF/YER057c/UK114 family)